VGAGLPAAICIALAQPYAGEPPALRADAPAIPATAFSAEGFAPPGWEVVSSAEGDLDFDGHSDLAVILKGADPACITQAENASEPLDTNPRVLLIAFAKPENYVLQMTNAAVIPRKDDPYMDDPLTTDAFTITGGVLHVGLTYWRSMGGWTTFSTALSFRWDGRTFPLIGYERHTTNRASGETERVSVNYPARRAFITTGSIEDDKDGPKRWRHILRQTPETLASIGDGLAFEPKLAKR
jgi:hypothetical protein